MNRIRTEQLLARAFALANSSHARIERAQATLLSTEAPLEGREPKPPASVILLSRKPLGGSRAEPCELA